MTFRAFWQELGSFGDAPALVERDATITYAQLARLIEIRQQFWAGPKKLVFLALENNASCLITYLALLQAGHSIYLSSRIIPAELLGRYRPDAVVLPSGFNADDAIYQPREYDEDLVVLESLIPGDQIHGDVSLILSTSGSTGSPKAVCLSSHNLAAAAQQVRESLRITPDDRTITALPLQYVYGLSVLHSHLSAGASLVLTNRSLMERAFWEEIRRLGVTSLSGVPWTYKLMRQLGLDGAQLPSLRSLTQSGAKLDSASRNWLLSSFTADIFFMYGLTEACGRVSVLPPELAREKPLSVGMPVPFGNFQLDQDEVIFTGPNVMLGYARSRTDLVYLGRPAGTLATGDLGEIDADGCLYITGRASRLSKVLGVRIDLDEVEDMLSGRGPVAALSDDNSLTIWFERADERHFSGQAGEIARSLGLPKSVVRLEGVDALPRHESGKIAYCLLGT